nr:hypothetical protein DM860_016188 [Ipomoea trifida]
MAGRWTPSKQSAGFTATCTRSSAIAAAWRTVKEEGNGTKVQAMLYDKDIDGIDKRLEKPIAWVRGKIRLLKRDGFDYYVGCNYCNKIVHSTEGLQLYCMNSGQTDGITVRRYKVDIEIFDNVGSVRVTMFNHEVHRLLLLTSSNIPTL